MLVGVSIGLGIGIGLGAGIAASRKVFPLQTQDQKLVIHFAELTNEIKELRGVMVRLEVCFTETRTTRIVPLKGQLSARQSDEEETEEDEFYEMSGESEPLSRSVSSLIITTCLDTRQPGTVFKKLDTRQSEILTNFLEIARLIPLRT